MNVFSYFFPLTHGAYGIIRHLDPWIVRHLLEYYFVHLSWVIHPLDNYHFSMAHGLYNTLIIIIFP